MTEYSQQNAPKKGLIVSPIENGTVIDHLTPGKAIKIADMLGLMQGAVVIIGQNLKSTKYGKKDIIKVENRFLTEDECSKIALIAPHATVNIIRDSALYEKRNVEIPDLVEDVALCSNANCITNKEKVPTRLFAQNKNPLVLVCHYCGFEIKGDDLKLKG